MFSLRWSTCWVRLAVRPSDWVTENRCEHNLQLPPPAKQHHQSWQGLHWFAVQSLNRRVKGLDRHAANISLFVCLIWSFILRIKSCWNPKRCQKYEGVPFFLGIEVMHVLLILDHPLLLLAGKKDAELAAPILAALKKQLARMSSHHS